MKIWVDHLPREKAPTNRQEIKNNFKTIMSSANFDFQLTVN